MMPTAVEGAFTSPCNHMAAGRHMERYALVRGPACHLANRTLGDKREYGICFMLVMRLLHIQICDYSTQLYYTAILYHIYVLVCFRHETGNLCVRCSGRLFYNFVVTLEVTDAVWRLQW